MRVCKGALELEAILKDELEVFLSKVSEDQLLPWNTFWSRRDTYLDIVRGVIGTLRPYGGLKLCYSIAVID